MVLERQVSSISPRVILNVGCIECLQTGKCAGNIKATSPSQIKCRWRFLVKTLALALPQCQIAAHSVMVLSTPRAPQPGDWSIIVTEFIGERIFSLRRATTPQPSLN